MSKVTLTRYNDNGKSAYVVSYNGKYGILTDLSEDEVERIESTFNMVLGMCVGAMGEVEE
jgi:hypothetical protein